MVSVIIATYNSPLTLKCSIQSVLQQTYQDFEIWVIGDACSDNSAQIVAELDDSRVRWFNRATNSGSQGLPNNDGLARARGNLIAYLGHDDLWLPWHLASLVSLLETEQADLVHSICVLLGPEGLRKVSGAPPPGLTYDNHHVPPSSWLQRAGLGSWLSYDQTFLGVDQEYTRRLHRQGYRMLCMPRISVVKFPSAWWSLYSMNGTPPQLRCLAEIQRDPQEMESQILHQVLLLQANQSDLPLPPVPRLLRLAISSALQPVWRALEGTWFGRWRYRRIWAAGRAITLRCRGLSPEK